MRQPRSPGAIEDRARTQPPPSASEHRAVSTIGRPGPFVLLALGVVVLLSLGLQVWAIWGDLPYAPDVDEPIFLRAAVRVLQHASLNPDWFGNPGSTTIYPIAALIEIWYFIAHHVPPFAHPMVSISRELATNPLPFYLIGRLVSAAYGTGAVVATWLIGRRIIGDAGGLLAALVLPATAIVVFYGQLVRTDTAGLFFALIALWLILRAMDDGRSRTWALAAVAIGLAVSSRYFFATLIVPYAVAAWLSLRPSPARPMVATAGRGRWRVPLLAGVAAPVAFLVTSPFFLIDLPKAVADIRLEARTVHAGADGLSPLGNFLWYVGTIVPTEFGPGLIVLAIIGVIVLWRLDRRALAVLAAFGASYLVGVSASPLHWDRYIIPLVPVIAISAAAAVLRIGDLVVRSISRWRAGRGSPGPPAGSRSPGRGRPLAIGAGAAILFVLLIQPIVSVAGSDRLRAMPTTRVLVTRWITANLPANSRIGEELYTAYLDNSRDDILLVFSLGSRTLDSYRSDGFRYLISSSAMANRYTDAVRYPQESAFYQSLQATGRLLASFEPGPDTTGPEIRVYAIDPP